MELSLTFLGTAGAVPTPSRGLSSTLVQRGGDRFLVDCGEGTQRQLIKAAVGITQIQRILLTHLHADHYLGLPGMLKTWELWGREEPAEIYGPRGLFDLVEALRRVIGRISFPVEWRELAPGERLSFPGYRVETIATEHRIPSLGYGFYEDPRPGRFDPAAARKLGVPEGPAFGRLQHGEVIALPDGREVRPDDVMGPSRPGRKVVVTGDTRPCEAVLRAARGCDCLVHDSTFTSAEQGRASETSHTTAAEAGRVASQAGVKLLVLTHLSFRHPPRDIHNEARGVFENCVLPSDFDRVVVPFPEKGPPYLVKPTLTEADAARAMPVPAQSFEL
ncbi:MAG: ribonuclease Z [Candidatus Sericytochromatia bacterium]|nr:ribonuclease Z [Candidatus Tanganyikabacteria bacterium]